MGVMDSDHDDLAYRAARIRAAYFRYQAQVAEVEASVIKAGAAMKRLAKAIQVGTDRDVAEHPDLAELNVQLDGFYGEDHRWTT